jgi:ribonuclease HI
MRLVGGTPTSPRGMRICHLFFADDSLLFCKATAQEWGKMSALLETYEKAFGQRLNKDKTAVFFSRNTTQIVREEMLRLVGVPASQRYDTYLGLPALVGKSRIREFQMLKDRVKRRVSDWKTKLLSQAGKEILLKAVIQAIPTYSMSIFLLPKELCKDLNKMMQNFWWGQKEKEKKIHWMKWEKMGLSKTQGGMGFRDLSCFNKALLAKQSWRLMQNPESLAAKIIKAKYFHRHSFLEAKLGTRPSYAWRSILEGRELFKEGCFWRIGDGKSVSIWGDKWIPRPSTYSIQSPCNILSKEAKVAKLFEEESTKWNKSLIKNIFSVEEEQIICNIPVSKYQQKDKLIWAATTTGEFTVKSAYHLEKEIQNRKKGECSNQGALQAIWKIIWKLQIPNSTKVFMWRACHNILPTKGNLKRRGIGTDDLCQICCQEKETVFHVLWECPAAQDVWGASERVFQKRKTLGTDFMVLVGDLADTLSRGELFLFAVTAKEIWRRRNVVLHGGVFTHPSMVAKIAQASLQQFQSANASEPRQDDEDYGANGIGDGSCWKAPPRGVYKANWDYAVSAKNKCMGVGVIIRDGDGQISAAKSASICANFDPAAGEALAALHAAEFCRDLGIPEVILEGDSLMVTRALEEKGENWLRYGQIVEDTKSVLRSFRQWRISHVRREANGAAHGLAKEAIRSGMDKVWMEEIPHCISNIVCLERNALLL